VRALGDVAGYLVEVEELHGFGIGLQQRERGACAARRTDGAEQIGIFVALVGRLSRSRPTPGPSHLPAKGAIAWLDFGILDKQCLTVWVVGIDMAQAARIFDERCG
jgi:hypothetical protein